MSDNSIMGADGVNWGWVIFLILILWFFVGGGLGGGFGYGNRFGYGYNNGFLAGQSIGDVLGLASGKLFGTTNCDLETNSVRQEAQIRYDIEAQGNATRTNDTANANMLATKIDFYAYQDLRDKLSESQRENMMLQNKLYSDGQFNAVNQKLNDIACKMAVKPDVVSLSAACPAGSVINQCQPFLPYGPFYGCNNNVVY